MTTLKISYSLFALLLLLMTAPAVQSAEGEDFLKISEVHYADWITTDPVALLPEFERGCKAVATYLQSQQLEFNGDDCVSNLYTAATFIARTNEFVDHHLATNPTAAEVQAKARAQYDRVVSEVIGKAIGEGKAVSQKENANLIYTVIVTIAKDVLTHYYQSVLANPNEAQVLMRIAEQENEKRIRREGEYQQIYERLPGR
jgi:acetyltransferase-like isoleucine patch superfamily enzyme